MNGTFDQYLDHKKMWHFEGDSGMKRLNELASDLGYRREGYEFGSPLERFLSDNPDAQRAIVDWIEQTLPILPEWVEALKSELPEELEENEDES